MTDVALAANGFAHAAPAGYGSALRSMDLSSGLVTRTDSSSYSGQRVRIAPGSGALWTVEGSYDLVRYDVSSGVPKLEWRAYYSPGFDVCGDLWFAEDGARAFTKCGDAVRIGPSPGDPAVYAGSIPGFGSSYGSALGYVHSLAHSTRAGRIAATPEVSYYGSGASPDSTVRTFEDVYLGAREVFTLPVVRVGTSDWALHARFVFLTADGTRLLVIGQVDASAAAAQDWAFVSF